MYRTIVARDDTEIEYTPVSSLTKHEHIVPAL